MTTHTTTRVPRRRWPITSLLLVANVLLLLLIAWSWLQRPVVATIDPVRPSFDEPARVRLHPSPAHDALVERPLLWAERRPHVEQPPPAAAGPDPFAEVTVLGVMDSGSRSSVLLQTPVGVKRVTIGDAYQGWVLHRIQADQIEFMAADERVRRLALSRPRIDNGRLRLD